MELTLSLQTGTNRPPAEVARRRVLAQHVELRQLLRAGLEHVRAIVAGEQAAHLPLRLLVGVIFGEFVRHLADEEALIVPFLEEDLPLGPLRRAHLEEEHRGQRTELASLCAWPERGDEIGLAVSFRDLAVALLDDIEREDRELLIPEVIRDDGIVVDQCGG